jgi:hypothetical protein
MERVVTHNGVHTLIIDYLNCARYFCDELKSAFNLNVISPRARVLNLLPKEGVVNGVSYNFHGVGCYFEFDGGHIDIDFGPDGRCDGFDEFRLNDYLNSLNVDMRSKYKIADTHEFNKQFKKLIGLKIIWNPKLPPSEHLYYIR